jgi:hypothetical protein
MPGIYVVIFLCNCFYEERSNLYIHSAMPSIKHISNFWLQNCLLLADVNTYALLLGGSYCGLEITHRLMLNCFHGLKIRPVHSWISIVHSRRPESHRKQMHVISLSLLE